MPDTTLNFTIDWILAIIEFSFLLLESIRVFFIIKN